MSSRSHQGHKLSQAARGIDDFAPGGERTSRRGFLHRNALGIGGIILAGSSDAAIARGRPACRPIQCIPPNQCCICPVPPRGNLDWTPLAGVGGTPDSCTSANSAFASLGRWDEASPLLAWKFKFGFNDGVNPFIDPTTDTVTGVRVEILSHASVDDRIITNGLALVRYALPTSEWSDDKGCDYNTGCETWSSCGIFSTFEGDKDAWGLSSLSATDVVHDSFSVYVAVENIYDQSGGSDVSCYIDSIKVTVTRTQSPTTVWRTPTEYCLLN